MRTLRVGDVVYVNCQCRTACRELTREHKPHVVFNVVLDRLYEIRGLDGAKLDGSAYSINELVVDEFMTAAARAIHYGD